MNVTCKKLDDHRVRIETPVGYIEVQSKSSDLKENIMFELADDVLAASGRIRELNNTVKVLRADATTQHQIRHETETKYFAKLNQLETAQHRIADLEQQVFAMAQNNSEFVAAHQKVVEERDTANQRYKELDDSLRNKIQHKIQHLQNTIDLTSTTRECELTDQLRMAQDDNERLRAENERVKKDMIHSGKNAHQWFNDGREAVSNGFDTQFEPASLCNLVWQWGYRTQSLRNHLSDARKEVKRLNKLVPKKKKLKLTPFERDMLKNISSSLGLSFEQLCEDHATIGGNYSSARAAMEAFEKAIKPMRVINQINADDFIREHLLSEEGEKKVFDVVRRNSKAVKVMLGADETPVVLSKGYSVELTEKLKKLKPSEFMAYVLNTENAVSHSGDSIVENDPLLHAMSKSITGESPAGKILVDGKPIGAGWFHRMMSPDSANPKQSLRDYLKSGQKPRVKMYKEEARRSVGYNKFDDRSEFFKAELVGELIDFPNHFVILLNGSHRFVAAHEIKCTGPSPTINDVLTHKASGELWSVYRIQKERLDAATIFTLNTPRGNQCSVKESELSQYFIW